MTSCVYAMHLICLSYICFSHKYMYMSIAKNIHVHVDVTSQVLVYEEDFKTEREDRVRAFSERNEEGERYRAEIERLQTQLSSHKGNLSDLEKFHLARQRELMQALEDLKKAQEEIQAKTSQVKQYKKQHNGLVAKVHVHVCTCRNA